MQKYICNLLILALGASSTYVIAPCHAQTAVKSNSQNTDNISSISSNSPSAIQIQLPDLTKSTDSKPTIVSEADNQSSVSNAINATQLQVRVPIFSRIFRSPSMQQ